MSRKVALLKDVLHWGATVYISGHLLARTSKPACLVTVFLVRILLFRLHLASRGGTGFLSWVWKGAGLTESVRGNSSHADGKTNLKCFKSNKIVIAKYFEYI